MATTGVRLAEANDDRFNAAWNHAVLGFLDLSLADHEGACDATSSRRFASSTELDAAEPAIIPCVPDLVEALVGARADRRRGAASTVLERQAGARGGGWAAATASRGRSLVAAAAGDLVAAERSAERSIELLERVRQPFEAARSRLVLGQVHRRAKKKRLAREWLERARDAFAELGAPLWADRADAELARIGGRPSTPFDLTETETQIASLVAQGRTNQETADALFLSPNTVQTSLKRVYQKLGVRSRTELAARVGRGPDCHDQTDVEGRGTGRGARRDRRVPGSPGVRPVRARARGVGRHRQDNALVGRRPGRPRSRSPGPHHARRRVRGAAVVRRPW